MARLNDAPGIVEPVEALKRRFLRQNRDLARTNSTQSLRIRHLETEVSRILAENIALREQVIKLKLDLESRPGSDLLRKLNPVKAKVQIKLGELGDLFRELENFQGRAEDGPTLLTEGPTHALLTEPSAARALATSKGSNVTKSQDGRLSPILEGTNYSKRLLSPSGIAALSSHSTDEITLPSAGSPPIVSLASVDDLGKGSAPTNGGRLDACVISSPPSTLYKNLEVRRRRRDTSSPVIAEIERIEGPVEREHMSDGKRPANATASFKVAAKRKLIARDEASTPERVEQIRDDFQFLRRAGLSNNREITKAPCNPARNETQGRPDSAKDMSIPRNHAQRMPRKVLAPKCINTDPTLSPSKAGAPDKFKKNPPAVDCDGESGYKGPSRQAQTLNDERSRTNLERTSLSGSEPPERPLHIASGSLSPDLCKTPLARIPSQDTPPPSDLSLGVVSSDVKGTLGRSSRRVKGSISYVQPNLRDKLRRPTKELVDAVIGEGRSNPIQSDGVTPDPNRAKNETVMKTVVVKWETDQQDAGSNPIQEPLSPLTSKRGSNVTDADLSGKRSSSDSHGDNIAEGRRVIVLKGEKLKREESTKMSPLGAEHGLFDIQASSPSVDTCDATSTLVAKQSRRVSRRHSSEQILHIQGTKSSSEASSQKRRKQGRDGDFRRPGRNDLDQGRIDKNTRKGSTGGASMVGMQDRIWNERTASRRRSMML